MVYFLLFFMELIHFLFVENTQGWRGMLRLRRYGLSAFFRSRSPKAGGVAVPHGLHAHERDPTAAA